MRRLCTEQEKRILSKNWRDICTGFAGKSAHSKVTDIFLVIIVWGIVGIGSVYCFGKILNEWTMSVLWFVESIIVIRFVNLGLFTIRVSRIKKSFLKKKQLYINGATVVDVKKSGLYIAYTYVEDDEFLFGETPYGITVETLIGNVPDIKTGDRLLLLYGEVPEGAQGEISLQIMRMSPELENEILKNQAEKREIPKDIKFLRCFPHPNATIIQKEKRMLEPEEKEKIAAWFLKKEKRVLRILILMSAVVYLGCINGITALLLSEGILENGLQGSALTIYLLVTVAIIVLLAFLWHILLKRSINRSTEIKYMQEVLFKSIEVREKGQTSSCFYEWNGMKFKEVKYDTISPRAEYGKIYIKYFSEKCMVVMVKK